MLEGLQTYGRLPGARVCRGSVKKSVWTMNDVWAGPKGQATVETNGRGEYRVTFGEVVKHFSAYGTAQASATVFAKACSGRDVASRIRAKEGNRPPYTHEQMMNAGTSTFRLGFLLPKP